MNEASSVSSLGPSSPEQTNAQRQLSQFESDRLNRRKALAKFGLGLLGGTVAMLSFDDVARLAVRTMAQGSHDNRITETLVREFSTTGIAFATVRRACSACIGDTNSAAGCGNDYCFNRKKCQKEYLCSGSLDYPGFYACLDKAKDDYNTCITTGNGDTNCTSDPVNCDCHQDETPGGC